MFLSSIVEKLPCRPPSRSTVPRPARASAWTRLSNSASDAAKTAVQRPSNPLSMVFRNASDFGDLRELVREERDVAGRCSESPVGQNAAERERTAGECRLLEQ